jgi:hypothetical protein
MKDFIRKRLCEDLKYYHAKGVSPDADKFGIGVEEDFDGYGENSKWNELEQDVQNALTPIIDKHQNKFGVDSYGVIDAIHQVFDSMFQKVR